MEFTVWHEGLRDNSINSDEGLFIGVRFDMDKPHVRKDLKDLNYNVEALTRRSNRMNQPDIIKLFGKYTNTAVARAMKTFKNFGKLNDARKVAVAYITYVTAIHNMKKFIAAIEKDDFALAATELKKTKWFETAGRKGSNVTRALIAGDLMEVY